MLGYSRASFDCRPKAIVLRHGGAGLCFEYSVTKRLKSCLRYVTNPVAVLDNENAPRRARYEVLTVL